MHSPLIHPKTKGFLIIYLLIIQIQLIHIHSHAKKH
jgi:hypothetical protein